MKIKRALPIYAILGALGACVVWLLAHRAEPRTVQESLRVHLTSRTLTHADLKGAFAAVQTPTVRGTVPCIVVCRIPVTREVRRRVESYGARVMGFLPSNALAVEADAAAFAKLSHDADIAAVGEFAPGDKIQKGLLAENPAFVDVKLIALTDEDRDALAQGVAEAGGTVLENRGPTARRVCARLSPDGVKTLARRGEVRWIERLLPAKLMNDVAVNAGLMNVREVWDTHGLTGRGQTLTTSDSGIDTGSTLTVMDDFKGQLVTIRRVNFQCQTKDAIGHGTHTAGSLVGNGALSGGQIKGAAYGARLFAWAFCDKAGGIYLPSTYEELFMPSGATEARIHSASWGFEENDYDTDCADVDRTVWENPEFLPVFSAGNSGPGAHTAISPGNAKNVVSAGASQNLRGSGYAYSYLTDSPSAVYSGSARGPTEDGRIKPDVVAPGTGILSTFSTQVAAESLGWGTYAANSSYTYNGGTSMAAPLAAGAAALVRQWLVERRGYAETPPTAALVKAVLLGGAHDMSRDAGANCGGAAPNNVQGWGRVDVGESLYPSNRAVKLVDRIPFASGSDFTVTVTTTNAAPLDVQLAWIDAPGALGAAKALVNDLDLVVSNGTTHAVWRGNGVSGGDRLNTVESVRIASAAPATYAITVRGVTAPYESGEGGAAALYVRGAFAPDAQDVEMVQLTVDVEQENGIASPVAGTHLVARGQTLTLSADDIVVDVWTNGTPLVRRNVSGWRGAGSVPATGTNASVTVKVQEDSRIVWTWNPYLHHLFRKYLLVPSWGHYYWLQEDAWAAADETVRLSIPDDVPGGRERIDLSGERHVYEDEDGTLKMLGVQRLGRIEIAAFDDDVGTVVTDAEGRMPSSFSFTVDRNLDVLFYAWDVASTNATSGLPNWWYNRHLREAGLPEERLRADADADGDGLSNAGEFAADTDPLDPTSDFRILSFSPTNIVWRGGRERTQVVERAERPGRGAVWTGVFTNRPPTKAVGTVVFPHAENTNSFYRIRAF